MILLTFVVTICALFILRFPEYSDRVLLGLVVSIGGLTERLVRFAGESLYQELRLMDEEQLGHFAVTLLKLFEQHLKVANFCSIRC